MSAWYKDNGYLLTVDFESNHDKRQLFKSQSKEYPISGGRHPHLESLCPDVSGSSTM